MMKKKSVLAGALALCLALSACGSKQPTLEEVEAAIRDGSVTVEDALDKGWIDQEWVDSYLEENSVPAADKIAVNKVGEFKTQTRDGETFTHQDLPDTAFVAFLDLEGDSAAEYYQALVDGVEDVRAAGADIVVCSKGGMDAEMYQDAPFSVVEYNDSMKQALGNNDEMASGAPCIGVWYAKGALLSAWLAKADAASLADEAAGFVAMSEEPQESTEGGMAAMPVG